MRLIATIAFLFIAAAGIFAVGAKKDTEVVEHVVNADAGKTYAFYMEGLKLATSHSADSMNNDIFAGEIVNVDPGRSIEVKLTRKSAELGRLKFEFASGEKSGTTNMKATLTIDPVVAAEPGHRWTINRQKFRAFVDNSAEMASIGAGFMDGLASLGMENGAPEPGEATRAVGVDPQAQVRIEEAKRMRAQREAAAPMADAGPMMDPTPKSY